MPPMLLARIKEHWLMVCCGSLIVLLIAAGVLVYRWLDWVSEAERQQQQNHLETVLRSCAGELAGAIQEIPASFHPEPRLESEAEKYLAELFLLWRSATPRPQLVSTISFATAVQGGEPSFRRFSFDESKFVKQEWPEGLESFRAFLRWRGQTRGGPPAPAPPGFALALSEDRPVIILPLMTIQQPQPAPPDPEFRPRPPLGYGPEQGPQGPPRPGDFPRPPFQRRPPPREERPAPRQTGWCLLELDRDYLLKQFLPSLITRNFSAPEMASYQVAIVTGQPRRLLYQSAPQLNAQMLSAVDATILLFSPQIPPGPGLRNPMRPVGAPPPPEPISPAHTWQIVAKHEAGSIAAVINAQRRRNLIIAFGMLLLLAGSALSLVWATQRTRALAQRQMEFVAGVSHELRTPLTVIQSAGFNLANGRVEEADRVRQYGAVIQTEGRRLSEMIEQMLSFAGLQSGRVRYDLAPTSLQEIIHRALEAYRAAFAEAGWQIEQEIQEKLPPVIADAQTLESAIKNLLHNALKYAASGKWLRISAREAVNNEVLVTVEDHGPGIDTSDLPHIFEPFYRGQKVVASPIPGAGLGLSLLQRHLQAYGGRVTVQTSSGKGTVFTLHLPASPKSNNGQMA